MKKSWHLTEKILSGEKTVECRWYMNRAVPWGKVKAGDTLYFKDSGEPVRIKAKVARVLQFDDLSPVRVRTLLKTYGKRDGIEKKDIREFFKRFKNKRRCIIVFLKDPKRVKPFDIDKTGFGMMSAWIATPKVEKIKKRPSKTGAL